MKNEFGLTDLESLYFHIMRSGNVLYLKGQPGTAKTAIGRAIAEKTKCKYFDLRLSQMDETDLGAYPVVTNNDSLKVVDFAVPRWALEANKQPSIIHFEEANRARLPVRNAALQILNEKEIGSFFKFNDNVYMMMSGNLGEEDGTEVEEFDAALNNRLVHLKHEMGIKYWIDNFASENVHNVIVSFLENSSGHYYKFNTNTTEQGVPYATPRSWTNFSKLLTEYGIPLDAKANDTILNISNLTCHMFVGASAAPFNKHIRSSIDVSIKDIINNYDGVQHRLKKIERSRISELIQNLYEFDIKTAKNNQLDNVIKFIKRIWEDKDVHDELARYLAEGIIANCPYNSDNDTIIKGNNYYYMYKNLPEIKKILADSFGRTDKDFNKT